MWRGVALLLLAVSAANADTWIWSEPTGHSPQPRFEHTATRIGNHLYVFGGTLTNEVHEADLHVLDLETDRWSIPVVKGNKPGPTMSHSTFTHGDFLYVMFGSNGKLMTNRIYRLNTATNVWERVVARGRIPTPRAYQATAIVGNDVFVFGGFDGRSYLNDLHRWTLPDPSAEKQEFAPWQKLQPTGDIPEIRAGASVAVYGRKIYVFGGFEVSIYKNDFFVLDADTLVWSRVHLSTTHSCAMPNARAMASLTLVGTHLVLFGGIYCSSSGNCTNLNDVHQFDIFRQSWLSNQPTGVLPPARYGHSGTLFGSSVLIFGGAAWPNLYNDIFFYDVYSNTFKMRSGLPPYSRKQHTLHATTDKEGRSRLVMFGGKHGSGGYSNHLHIFDIGRAEWTHPENSGEEPSPVGHHATALVGSNLYLFGGYNGSHSFSDVYSCDINSHTWTHIHTDGNAPPASHGHAVVYGASKFLHFGGVDCNGKNCLFFNELRSLLTDSWSWVTVNTTGTTPRPRASHTWTTLVPNSHYLFGGIGPSFTNYNDLFVYDELIESWMTIDALGTKPSPRFGHAAVEWNGNLVVFGGGACRAVGDCDYLNDVFLYTRISNTWSNPKIELSPPAGRLGVAGASVGEVLYFHGGATGDRIFGELVTVQPDDTVPENSIVFGRGKSSGTAGKNIKFFVQTQDSFNQNRTTGGDVIKATLSVKDKLAMARLKKSPIEVLVEDGENGVYKVEYTTHVAERYEVVVSVNGHALPTFYTTVDADAPHPGNTHSTGVGLNRCVAGEKCSFVVEPIDGMLNHVMRPSLVDVQINGPKRVLKKIEDTGNGKVAVEYTPEASGLYQIRVRVRTVDTDGSPFNLTVLPANPSPLESKASGDGLKKSVAGELGQFELVLFDRFENPITRGGDIVKAELTGPDELACMVYDNNNGTYFISYTAIRNGLYKLHVTINGEELKGSPFKVNVATTSISPATTFAYGTGLRRAIAGYRAYFTIQAADAFGNNMTVGGSKFNILFVSGDIKRNCSVTDHGDGTYAVSYVTDHAGDFIISATLESVQMGFQSIHMSPFLGEAIAAGADPTKSFVYVSNIDQPLNSTSAIFRSVMGVHSYFHIQAVDRYGNRKTTGGDHFVVELEGPATHDGFISDNGDGTYTGTYVAPAPGRYLLKIYYGNIPVSGTPIQCIVRPNFDTCPKDCSGRGDCVDNRCVCNVGFGGDDCSVEITPCPGNCMGSGVCLNNTCFCFPGFGGIACDKKINSCPNNCSKHGECVDSFCVCKTGYNGVDCSDNVLTCPDGCSGNGECVEGTCLCYPGFSEANCSKKSKFCPKGCSGKGNCLSSGLCSCYKGYTGLDCADDVVFSQTEKRSQESTNLGGALKPELPARLPRHPPSK